MAINRRGVLDDSAGSVAFERWPMTPLIVLSIGVAIVVIAVIAYFALKKQTNGNVPALPYEKRSHFLSAAERSLFGVLEQAVDGKYLIFAKIRVADLLAVQKGALERQGHMNRITSKHVDFVLCDRASVAPLLAVELDDSSHDTEARQKRDQFLDDAFRAAGVPILHVRASRSYDVSLMSNQILERLASEPMQP